MAYRDILVYADTDKAAAARLDVATAIASAHKAHLTAIHVIEPPYVPIDVGGALPGDLIQAQEDYARERAERTEQEVRAAERRSGLSIEWRAPRGDAQRTLALHSHYADLVVVGQDGADRDEDNTDRLAEFVVMSASRPVLVVPRFGTFATFGRHVLVAWNGTREASRALHDALPLLVAARNVTVLQVNPDTSEAPRIPGADIGTHLARHGVNATVTSLTANDIGTGDALLSRAADLGADLIVMGAYGHPRLLEYAFGGVTRHLLRHMTVPVLMAH